MKKRIFFLSLVAIALVFLLAFVFKNQIRAGLFLAEIITGNPVRPLSLLTPKPVIEQVTYQDNEGEYISADLWLPRAEGRYPGAVLHLGVDVDKADPRSTALANALARSGIVALVPNISSLNKRRVLEGSKDDLVNSFEYLSSHRNVKTNSTGFIAFCVSAGLIPVATADEAIKDKVAFLLLVNPYYDFANIYSAITTNKVFDGEREVAWNPHFKTVEVYNRETINLLDDDTERKLLESKLLPLDPKKLENREFGQLNSEEFNSLSPEAKNTYFGLSSKTKEDSKLHFDQRTKEQEIFRANLSPSTYVEDIKTKAFIVSDRNNVYIPFTEARLMNKYMKDSFFVETRLVPSGEFNQNLKIYEYPGELLKVIWFVSGILSELD